MNEEQSAGPCSVVGLTKANAELGKHRERSSLESILNRFAKWPVVALAMLLVNMSAHAASSGSFEDDEPQPAPSTRASPAPQQIPRPGPRQSITELFVNRKLACLAHWNPHAVRAYRDDRPGCHWDKNYFSCDFVDDLAQRRTARTLNCLVSCKAESGCGIDDISRNEKLMRYPEAEATIAYRIDQYRLTCELSEYRFEGSRYNELLERREPIDRHTATLQCKWNEIRQ